MTKVTHRRFVAVAIPIIFANITVPIIGLVDTAVIGHLGSAVMIAGAKWVLRFLLASTTCSILMTGVSAFTSQARGEDCHMEVLKSGLEEMVLGCNNAFLFFTTISFF